MDNAPLTINQIYQYDTKANQSWNIPEYRAPSDYHDYKQQIKRREWQAKKKIKKPDEYITKKGNFMEDHLKLTKLAPPPNRYIENRPWSFQKEKQMSRNRKIDKSLTKNTFLEQIESEQKNRKKPGVCTYSLQKTEKEKKAELHLMRNKTKFQKDTHTFMNNIEFLAGNVPGAGAHNPHFEIKKIRKSKTEYKDWVKKHEKQSEREMKREKVKPSPGTYNPLNATFTTFTSLQKKNKEMKNKKNKFFGGDARFQYTRAQKKVIKESRPGPSQYKTEYEWPKSSSHIPWHNNLAKSSKTVNIYL